MHLYVYSCTLLAVRKSTPDKINLDIWNEVNIIESVGNKVFPDNHIQNPSYTTMSYFYTYFTPPPPPTEWNTENLMLLIDTSHHAFMQTLLPNSLPRWGHSATKVIIPDGIRNIVLLGESSVDNQYYGCKGNSKNHQQLKLLCSAVYRCLKNTCIIWLILGSGVHASTFKSSGQLGILSCINNLAQYVVEGVFTGQQLGHGYFGSVEEVYI